jgi:cytochrome c peroxidase
MRTSARRRTGWLLTTVLAGPLACANDAPLSPTDDANASAAMMSGSLTPAEELGKQIFFDKSLSLRRNQACAACHAPEFGWTGPQAGITLRGAVYMGSVRYRAGGRKPPTAAYATQSPVLALDAGEGIWIGGNFWDGRATGDVLGNPAADQALGPFLNHVEQALPDAICVLYRIAEGPYADLWEEVWGNDLSTLAFPSGLDRACRSEDPISYPGSEAEVAQQYHRVGLSVAAYEGSDEVNAFTSKFDAVQAGAATFTALEQEGFELFVGKAMCSACHPAEGQRALFTDYSYDNLGAPANPLNPVYEGDPGFVDLGLGAVVDDPSLYGAVKVPTLRNVGRAPGGAPKAYGHNGVFKSLEQIVHFYNTRDVLRQCAPGEVSPTPAGLAAMGFEPACWPEAEVPQNVNDEELGNLGLTRAEERALVAFMEALSDGWSGGR